MDFIRIGDTHVNLDMARHLAGAEIRIKLPDDEGQVRRILPADEEPPESLLAELRRLHPRPPNAGPAGALETGGRETSR